MADGSGGLLPNPHEGPLGPTPPGDADDRVVRRRGVLLALGFVALLGLVVLLGLLASMVVRHEANALDTLANPFMHDLESPPLDVVMNVASFVGTDWVLVPVAIVVAIGLAWAAHRREGAFLATALGGSVLLNAVMKLVFHRARPVLPWARVIPDYSFPSGHSMNALVFGLAVSFIVWRLFGPRPGVTALAAAVLASLAIGLSRIYFGYHYLTDVVGGFASAILWVAIVVAVFRPGARSRTGPVET